jgi:hypothetical protein
MRLKSNKNIQLKDLKVRISEKLGKKLEVEKSVKLK